MLYTARASRRHRCVDNQRVKQKIVLPTTAMVNFSIDIASLFTPEINREIFIPNREVGRFSILGKNREISRQIGRLGSSVQVCTL